MGEYVAGIDLGGTKIYAALADLTGQILAELKIPTRAQEGAEAVIHRLAATVVQLQEKAGRADPPLALGVGAPGPLNAATGVVYQAPNLGWRDVPLKEKLERLLGIPVYVDNDANLAALGEHRWGAGQGAEHMVYITVSTGVGGGLILGGRLYRGASHGAGEIGHMVVDPRGPRCGCGSFGCLEALASGTAMARAARRLVEEGRGKGILAAAGGDPESITSLAVAQAAAAGDEEARAIISEAGRALGIGVASLINLLNPAVVVLGGGAMRVGSLLWEAMAEEVGRRALEASRRAARIVPAALGERSGVLGAVALALEEAVRSTPV